MTERRDFLRTDEMIKDAYIRLLFEKNTERITVSAILNEANISRGTFYAHFHDIPDLAGKVMEEMMQDMAGTLSCTDLEGVIKDPTEQVERILGVIMERKEILSAVLFGTESPKLIQTMKALFIRVLAENRLANTRMEVVDLVDACVAGAAFDACLTWLRADNGITKEEAVRTIGGFLAGGLGRIYKSPI